MPAVQTIPAHAARTLLLDAQGLLASPRRRATTAALDGLITQLGFVQIDSINVVERAHHLTLGSRFDGYRPAMLHALLERERSLFEHWTHDASAIPVQFFPHWKVRFADYRKRMRSRNAWWRQRMGPTPAKTLKHVLNRIEREGPLQSKDFEHNRAGQPNGWWGWKPQKAALEHLWRTGDLAIAGRVNFQKVYDLTERVFPDLHDRPAPHSQEYIDWACRSAMQRLVIATPAEIAAFWNALSLADARAWCKRTAEAGEIVPVKVEAAGEGRPAASYAMADWQDRLDAAPTPPKRMRLLSPFDPVIRDRKRLLRLFAFDYRFEAFVPAPKRVYGYYVMPLLEGDRIIGRVDPKFNRAPNGKGKPGGELTIRRVYLEP